MKSNLPKALTVETLDSTQFAKVTDHKDQYAVLLDLASQIGKAESNYSQYLRDCLSAVVLDALVRDECPYEAASGFVLGYVVACLDNGWTTRQCSKRISQVLARATESGYLYGTDAQGNGGMHLGFKIRASESNPTVDCGPVSGKSAKAKRDKTKGKETGKAVEPTSGEGASDQAVTSEAAVLLWLASADKDARARIRAHLDALDAVDAPAGTGRESTRRDAVTASTAIPAALLTGDKPAGKGNGAAA